MGGTCAVWLDNFAEAAMAINLSVFQRCPAPAVRGRIQERHICAS